MTPTVLLSDFDVREAAARKNADWLARQVGAAAGFASVEDIATRDAKSIDVKWQRGFDHHLRHLRGGISRTFMRADCFVGLSVIDDMIFASVKACSPDIALNVFTTVIANGLHDPGMVVFPIHGLGVALPMSAIFSGDHPELLLASGGFVAITQTNDVEKTIRRLDAARSSLGIAHSLDVQGIRSYSAGQPLEWLRRNPLLVFRFNSYSHEPFENQLFYQLRLRTITSLLLAASLHSPRITGEMDTRIANNQETLDLAHYLRLEVSPRLGGLEAERIPRNVDQLSLAEASDVDAVISVASWNIMVSTGKLDQIHRTLRLVEAGYLTHRIMDRRQSTEAAFYVKLARSVDNFRRSFRSNSRPSERVIALAVAFETLLTDSYSGGVTARIRRRVVVCLNSSGMPASCITAVERLFDARGKFVHSGFGPEDIDLREARLAYLACLNIVAGLAQGATLSDPVIGSLLGDRPAATPFWVRAKQAWRTLLGR